MPPSMYRQDSRQGPAAGSTGSSLDLWIAPSQKEVVLQKTPTAFLYRHMWGFSDAHVPSMPCRSSAQTVPLVFWKKSYVQYLMHWLLCVQNTCPGALSVHCDDFHCASLDFDDVCGLTAILYHGLAHNPGVSKLLRRIRCCDKFLLKVQGWRRTLDII